MSCSKIYGKEDDVFINHRILFKYNLITFKAIKFSQPIYLSSLIKTSCLMHGNRLSLSSVSHKKAIGRRGFAMACPPNGTDSHNQYDHNKQ